MPSKRVFKWENWKPCKCKVPKKLHCPQEFQQLRKRCLASIRDFYSEGDVINTPDGKYIYRDNGANILAVAHLDVVCFAPRHFGSPKGKANKIYSAQLDDRLGAYVILDVLPTMGVKVDTLLTTGEESCRSTGAYFQTDKPYNWMVEFDRAGQDVVLYDYWTLELKTLLKSLGNKVGVGSYSDIAAMEHLGIAGFNWGIGYYDHHFNDSFFKISEYQNTLLRFSEFYNAYKDKKFEYDPYAYSEWPGYDSDNETDPWGYKKKPSAWCPPGWIFKEEEEALKEQALREEDRILWEQEEFRQGWSKYKTEHGKEDDDGEEGKRWVDAFLPSEMPYPYCVNHNF